MLKKYNTLIRYAQITTDFLALAVAYFFAVVAEFHSGTVLSTEHYFETFLWFAPVIIISYHLSDVYSGMRGRLYRKEVLLIAKAHLTASFLVIGALFFDKHLDASPEIIVLFTLGSLVFVLMERYVIRRTLRYFRAKGFNLKHVLIIGAGPLGADFAEKLREHRSLGYNLAGMLDDDETKHHKLLYGVPILGGLRLLPKLLDHNHIDEVCVALPLRAHRKYGYIIKECERHGVRLRIIPDYNRFFPGSPTIQDFDGIPILNIRNLPLDDPVNKLLKRILDITVSLIAILLTSPVLLIIALGIKLSSPGPILFRQERIGMSNRAFDMLKFRSMSITYDNSAATVWTTVDDPRKTAIGSFLRKTSLDELPQFFNVLFGSMSVVGPRPERPFFVDQFKEEIPRYMVKHQVKPGITGWAQVNGWRGDTSIEKRIECDLYYIENWDVLFDLRIIFLTIFKGFVNSNAY